MQWDELLRISCTIDWNLEGDDPLCREVHFEQRKVNLCADLLFFKAELDKFMLCICFKLYA